MIALFRRLPLFSLVSLLVTAAQPASGAEPAPLIPRGKLFAPPVHGAPLVSPDGKRLAWLGATNGVTALWVRPVDPTLAAATNATRIVSPYARGAIRQPAWQSDGQALLYLQEVDALGNAHLMQAHVDSGIVRDLTPFPGAQARLIATSPRVLDEILVTLNLRDHRLADVFRVDVRNGALTLEAENPGDISAWYADSDLQIRLAQVLQPNGDLALSTRSDPRSVWRPILRSGTDDSLGRVAGFSAGGTNVWLISSVGAPAPRLLEINLATGKSRALSQDARYDVLAASLHPFSNTLDGVQIQRSRLVWQVADTNLLADLAALRRFRDADVDIVSRDVANNLWTVSFTQDVAPVQFALYRRDRKEVTPLFPETPALADQSLAPMRHFEFKARDGLSIEGYLTLPLGVEAKNLPTVVLVHGGPWSRTGWGLHPESQWLANRGYAVVQANFRGSTGYGKGHFSAGDKEWGGKLLQDLVDARDWAVRQGHADPKRVAIMGTGFGGYAATAALALHPGAFAAGVSESGPLDLLAMIQSVPASAPGMRAALERRVGHPTNDLERLRAHSPVTHVAKIQSPILLAVTSRDPDIPLASMDAFVTALRANQRPVEYLYFPEEGASIRSLAARLRFAAAVEAFLARHLGGRAEPPSPGENFESLRR
ncbi:MAG: S9 family peptidase [Verrucomicrobiales bacterium]|nr:S9 family peptidase [Verrucomicrobiales bacterium]